MAINPFDICDVAQQAQYRAFADREAWVVTCVALGADRDALDRFDADARRYAPTTIYPNSDVVAYCRRLVRDGLLRGEPVPTTAEAAIAAESHWQMTQLALRIEGLRKGRR